MAREYLDDLIRRSKTPGLQYVAVDADRVLVDYAGGLADIAHHRPMSAVTSMMAYSMSKTITAVAVLQLVQAGKLGLDDALDRHVPGQPYGGGVTVRQLIAHTAGLPNPIPLRWVHTAAEHPAFDDDAALARQLAAHPKPASAPGIRYKYSNIGYWLLGRVVSSVSGRTFRDYVADAIVRPLGLSPAELGYTITNLDAHADGYLEKYSFFNLMKDFLIDPALVGGYEGPWLRINDHYPNGASFGGLVGTAHSFAAFLQDQLRPRSVLLNEVTRRLMFERQRLANGATVPMTLGWHAGELAGRTVFFKEGGGGGFHCLMRIYADAAGPRFGTVVMTNATGVDVAGCLDHVDRELLT